MQNLPQDIFLAPYFRVGFKGRNLVMGFGSIRKTESDPTMQRAILEIAGLALRPISRGELERKSVLKDVLKNGKIKTLVQQMIDNRYLVKHSNYDSNQRHSRLELYLLLNGIDPNGANKPLCKRHVIIAGCGGIGNMIAYQLASMRVEKLTLIDGDSIEVSNLSRQFLFDESDCGKNKSIVLAEKLRARFPDAKFESIAHHIEAGENMYPDSDLIVLSADGPGLVMSTNHHCQAKGTPFLNVGYVQDVAVWGPLVVPGKTACTCCMNPISNDGPPESMAHLVEKVNARYQAPSVAPINMLASSMAALDLLRFFSGTGTIQSWNARVGLWSHDLHIERQIYQKNPNCPKCSP